MPFAAVPAVNDPKLELYLSHRRALIDYARSIAGGRAQAEDVVQDAWLRFADERTGPNLRNPLGYLYRIVRNLALDASRRLSTEQREPEGASRLGELLASTPSPEAQVCDEDALQMIANALLELPERTRIAFEMHRFGDYTLQQIAQHLGVSVGLVHSLVRDAMTHCAERLGDHED
ncbi:RNA polymerase subunit sigma-24 [Pseudomonas sp. 21C1]|nr:RNA polymerase subunit sigma-24 [Pseudomonas sp. 21C1]